MRIIGDLEKNQINGGIEMSKQIETLQEIIRMQDDNFERLSKEIQACHEQLEGLMSAYNAATKRRATYQEQLIKMLMEADSKA